MLQVPILRAIHRAVTLPIVIVVVRYATVVILALIAALAVDRIPTLTLQLAAAFIFLTVTAWYGGVGPALVTPFVFVIGREVLHSPGHFLGFAEWTFTAGLALLTTAIGWSGEARRRAQALARKQATQLAEQARALGLAHIIFRDLDGQITAWNEGARRIYGWTREEAEGRLVHELLQTRFPVPLVDIQTEVLRVGEWEGEIINTSRDGHQLIVTSHWILYASKGRQQPNVAEVNNDVTEVRRAEEAIREADRRKDQFLATLAHELRNPLAPIRTGLDVLRMGGDQPLNSKVSREIHAMMHRQIEHMVRLIDDLLDVSRITTGKIELRRERVSLEAIVNDAIESARPQLDAAGHELIVTLPREPTILDVDRARMVQVLLNLLTNAAKFTDRGGQITLSAERNGSHIEARVRDTGIGISKDTLSSIFEMFTQSDSSIERSQGGLGIGLSLVRSLVEMHDGTVEAHSDGPGKGSEFVIRLPLPANQHVPPDAEPLPKTTANRVEAARRILIVDDNADAASSLALLLEAAGHECRTATDGRGALETAKAFAPDVFVLDIGMPGMSGYEVARRIRRIPQFERTTLIALTGWGQDEDRDRSLNAGFDVHLVKPVSANALHELIASWNGTAPDMSKTLQAETLDP